MAKKSAQETREERKADRVVASNRRATHEYEILDDLEVGIVLTGTEIKAIREGKATIGEAYARIDNGELWLIGANISPYSHGNITNHVPDRPRKLLAHKSQIRDLRAKVEQKGLTLVPLRLRLDQGRAKLDIGIAKGKKLHDRRNDSIEKDAKRDLERVIRGRD